MIRRSRKTKECRDCACAVTPDETVNGRCFSCDDEDYEFRRGAEIDRRIDEWRGK